MSGVDTIVIIVSRTKKNLEEMGAVSEETAKTPKELNLEERWLKTSSNAGVKVTKDGRYYLAKHKS